jgi:soluble lytic murein transglycosylase
MLQRNFRPFIRHGGSGVPRRFWEILFPLKYWESIRTEAGRRQIDPYLIASIIRQESGFEPTVVSNAGAVGIMQIMPHEAERIATAAGIQTPSRQELFDPHTNIAIGVAEYAQKLAVMRGTEVLAIAAYNAGEDVVGKWIAQAPLDDIDLFIESIPYNETRLYVKSVTRNRFEYRRIYEGVSSSS